MDDYIKDFDKWNREKKAVDKKPVNRDLFFHHREIWWCSAGLNIGVEADGKNDNFERPVLIIKKFNADMVWVLPLTTKEKQNKYHFKLEHEDIKSWVILSQIKAISTKRLLRKIGSISDSDFGEVISSVQSILKIESPLTGAFSEAEATNTQSIKKSAKKVNSSQKGSLLLELLIAIAILAVVLSVGTNAVYVSMQSGKTSGESDTAMGLASETLESVRAISDEQWQYIYDLTKGTQYHTVQSGNKWATSTASESIALNTASYTRYFIVQNVSRDPSARTINTTYDSVNDDPSTQQVVVTVSWNGSGSPITISDYLFRWRNKVCNQTDWSGGVGSGPKNCPDTTYGSIGPIGTEIDSTGGTLKLH